MANRQRTPVGYRPFRPGPQLQEGLLPVERYGGGAEAATARTFASLASEAFDAADRMAVEEAKTQAYQAIQGGGVAPSEISVSEPADDNLDGYFAAIRSAESGGNDQARNPNSTAQGRYQFLTGTWNELVSRYPQAGLTRDGRNDPRQQEIAIRLFTAENQRALAGRNIPITKGNLYAAHFLGAGGATQVLSAPDSARVADLLPSAVISANPFLRGMSVLDFKKWAARKTGGGSITPQGTLLPRRSGSDAASRAYNDIVDNENILSLGTALDADTRQIYELYGDDPAELERQFQALGAQYGDRIDPTYATRFRADFARTTRAYLDQARKEAAAREKDAAEAAFTARTHELETGIRRQIELLDPSEDADAAIARTSGLISAHYDSAAARGLISAEEAERKKAEMRRGTAVAYYERQASLLADPEDVASFAETIRADFAAGKVPMLDADGHDALQASLRKIEQDKRTDQTRASKALQERGDRLVARAAAGEAVDPAELSRLEFDARTAPDGARTLATVKTRIAVAESLRSLPLAESEATIAQLEREYADNPVGREAIAFARAELDRFKQALRTDPLGEAERRGVIPPAGTLDFAGAASAGELAGAVARRRVDAEAVAERFGVAPRYFRPGEAEALAEVARTDPARAVELTAGLVDGLGPASDDALTELSAHAPAVAGAATILSAGGDPAAARDAIYGASFGPDGKARPPVLKKDRAIRAAETIGESFLFLDPRSRNIVEDTAHNIARARIERAGVDPESAEAAGIYTRALDEAVGARYVGREKFGGFGEVNGGRTLIPSTMTADEVEDLVGSISDADLATLGRPRSPLAADGVFVSAADLRDAELYAVGDGIYRLAVDRGYGRRFIESEDGGFYTLDIRQLKRLIDGRGGAAPEPADERPISSGGFFGERGGQPSAFDALGR